MLKSQDENVGVKSTKKPKIIQPTPNTYRTIKPKVDSSKCLLTSFSKNKSDKAANSKEKRTTNSKYPRQCETCLEYFNNYVSFEKHIKTHQPINVAGSDIKVTHEHDYALLTQNLDLYYEVIENGDTEDLVMFSGSEGEEEKESKFTITRQQQHDGEPAVSLADLCRVCGKSELEMTQIYGSKGRKCHLGLKMNKCLPIKVTEIDSLPLSVCKRCVTRVEESYDLTSTCRKTDAMLTEMLAQQKILFEEPMPEGSFMINATSDDVDEINSKSASTENESHSTETIVKTESALPLQEQNNLVSSLSNFNETQSEIKYQCADCDLVFSSFKLYEDHISKTHQSYVCKHHVDFIGHSKEELQEHKKICYPYLCSVCGNTFKSSFSLNDHMKRHGERTYFCEICNKSFYRKFNLYKHKKVHNRTGKVECSLCNKKFLHQIYLTKHENMIHSKSITFICNICNSGFSNQLQIQKHCDSHSEEEKEKYVTYLHPKKSKFQCYICSKYFTAHGSLKEHLAKSHKNNSERQRKICATLLYTKKTKFQCDVCNVYFATDENLTNHKKNIHEKLLKKKEPKPIITKIFQCNFCTKHYGKKHHLQRHIMKTHVDQSSFAFALLQNETVFHIDLSHGTLEVSEGHSLTENTGDMGGESFLSTTLFPKNFL